MTRAQILERYRRCKVPLLLLGPPGVGKTDLATRIDPNLLRVNCAEFGPELMAAELFGTRTGAFTGATDRRGLVEVASTLFLDEAGELPSDLQARLLMLLDEGKYRPVGGTQVLKTDVRLILATWKDPADWMRPDLRDRFGFDVVRVPPLTEVELHDAIDAWTEAWNRDRTHRIRVRAEAAARLIADAMGSTRQLRKRLEYALLTAALQDATALELVHLPPVPVGIHPGMAVVRDAFEAAGGSAERVAERFGVSRSTAYRWRKALRLAPEAD